MDKSTDEMNLIDLIEAVSAGSTGVEDDAESITAAERLLVATGDTSGLTGPEALARARSQLAAYPKADPRAMMNAGAEYVIACIQALRRVSAAGRAFQSLVPKSRSKAAREFDSALALVEHILDTDPLAPKTPTH